VGAGSDDRPLAIDPVVGWRAWSVVEHDGSYRLASLTRRAEWPPGEPFTAACDRHTEAVPSERCTCGVYAATDPRDLARLGRIAGAAVGEVSLWASVVQHSRGMRGGRAYPARLRLACVACLRDGTGTPATVVDRERSDERTRIVPLCDRHANGRALADARQVERALLATYRVDVLPEEALARLQRRPAHGRRWAAAVAAALLVAAVATGVRDAVHERPTHPATASPVSAARDTSGANLPYQRTDDGVMSRIPSRAELQSPFSTMRCGHLTGNDVTRAECNDPVANVFVGEAITPRTAADGPCDEHAVASTRTEQLLLCWWQKPPNAEGAGHTGLGS
jgi:hypothetical protein